MAPLEPPPVCPAGTEDCPVLSELRRLQEECRRLQELSQTDPLTGLYNRRHLMTALDQEMERTRRSGLPTSLIMLDLDHFKRLNDAFGHGFGDTVLRRVAVILKENIRKLDIPCRYGGEEFVLVIPGARLPQAVQLAFRLRDLLPRAGEEISGRQALLTASFGVEAMTARSDLSPEAFLHQADRWLFQAKARGRNTVCFPDSPESGPEVGVSREEIRTLVRGGQAHGNRTGGSYG
jgi:diguanylate cyclase (GGDEF)-like protein